MAWLFLGILLAVVFYVLLQWWANAEVKSAKKGLLWAIGIVCLLLTLLLLRVGRPFLAALPALFAVWRIVGVATMLQKWFVWLKPSGKAKPKGYTGSMNREEALDVLGLEDGATKDDINKAYRRLMSQCHPDKGGSDWMAAKLTEAKRVLTEK